MLSTPQPLSHKFLTHLSTVITAASSQLRDHRRHQPTSRSPSQSDCLSCDVGQSGDLFLVGPDKLSNMSCSLACLLPTSQRHAARLSGGSPRRRQPCQHTPTRPCIPMLMPARSTSVCIVVCHNCSGHRAAESWPMSRLRTLIRAEHIYSYKYVCYIFIQFSWAILILYRTMYSHLILIMKRY
jgi:hypothetical protein